MQISVHFSVVRIFSNFDLHWKFRANCETKLYDFGYKVIMTLAKIRKQIRVKLEIGIGYIVINTNTIIIIFILSQKKKHMHFKKCTKPLLLSRQLS